MRDDYMERVSKALAEVGADGWLVRTDPGKADWLHEREWRIPSTRTRVRRAPGDISALIVCDPDWGPTEFGIQPTMTTHPTDPDIVERTIEMARDVPRWLWTGKELEILAPFDDVLGTRPF